MLERELKVVEDYMFIQQMRFGRRVVYESRLELDPGTVMIPAFTLQPLVENAVIHGLAKRRRAAGCSCASGKRMAARSSLWRIRELA